MTGILSRVAESALITAPTLRWKSFRRWTPYLFNAFQRVERAAFPPSLHYSRDELKDRASRRGFEGLILFDTRGPTACVLINQGQNPRTLYLDTLAVSVPKLGLGGRLLQALLIEATEKGYMRVDLDTEMTNDSGMSLVNWYHRYGFRITQAEDSKGNVGMSCDLSEKLKRELPDCPISLFSPVARENMPIHRIL